MTPLPVNPIVVLLTDAKGAVRAAATNVAPDLKVVTTTDPEIYRERALGVTFNTANEVTGKNLDLVSIV